MKPIPVVVRHLALALLLPAAVAAAQPAPAVRTVVHPVLNMYSSPTTETDVVSQAIYATPVAVLEEKDGWVRVKTPGDDYTGWVEASGLLGRSGDPYGARKATVQVRSLFAHVYREESVTKHPPMLTVPFETRLEVEGSAVSAAERWIGVVLPDGRRGMIQRGDVAPRVSALNVEETIALGKRFLGLPYTWGGTSSFGYDCSGFTQMLMRQRGYSMPRDASVQAKWPGLVAVQPGDLQPGDLVFFGSSEQRITHTGMYIGTGQFINSTTHETPTVRIDDINDPYWAKLLVGARRVRP